MKNKICELLAPAGNPECAMAAIDAGADAVYCGLGRFNARCRAENFNPDTLGAMIDHMHSLGKKLYLTFNTLLFEEELEGAAEMLGELTRLAPDALIVHDPGVIFMAKKYFPSLKLHASTQMGIHNSAGVAAMAELGIERVILERQIPLNELEQIVKKSSIEIEVFIHGSLCCSLSGRCLLSAELCGGSGNRGCCKQPCRRSFETEQGNIFPLSMRDLNAVEILPFLKKIGVSSLKIEGRLRGPDYVWKCVHAYRMLLDAPAGTIPPETLHEALTLLNAASARNEISSFTPEKMVDSRRIGVFGRQVGTVANINRKGILVKAASRIHLGDRLRLVPPDGGDGMSFSLTAMEDRQKKISNLNKGGMAFIPGKFSATPGWYIFKIGENGFDFSRQCSALPRRKDPLHLELEASAGKWQCRIMEVPEFIWHKNTDFAPAETHPADKAEIARVFSSGVPEKWKVAGIEIIVKGKNFFLPAAMLKSLRREFWECASPYLDSIDPGSETRRTTENFINSRSVNCETPQGSPEFEFEIPGFIAESDLPRWQKAVADAIAEGKKIFRAGGFHALKMLQKFPGITVKTAFPLSVTNSQCAALLAELEVSAAAISPEVPEKSLEQLRKCSILPLYHDPVKVPLLVSRAELLPAGVWRDRSGSELLLKFDNVENLWKLYKK